MAPCNYHVPKIIMMGNRGREGFRLPSLRTVQADLPHTALQSVVSSSGLARQGVGFGHGEKPPLSEEGIRPAAMVLQGMTQPPFQVVLTAEYGAQPASYKAIQDREDRTLRVFKVVEPALEHGIQLGNDTLQAAAP